MKRLFITTFFPNCSNNSNGAKVNNHTSLADSYSPQEEEPSSINDFELISRTLSSRGLTDNDLLKAVNNGRNTLQQLSSSLGISLTHLQEYHKHLVRKLKRVDDTRRREPSKPTPIRVTPMNHHGHLNASETNNKLFIGNDNHHHHHSFTHNHHHHHHHQSGPLQSSNHSLSSSLSSYVKENYFSEDVHTETAEVISSSSIQISTVSNTNTSAISEFHHSPFSSSLKSGGTISSSIDYNFFDDDTRDGLSAHDKYHHAPRQHNNDDDSELLLDDNHSLDNVVQNAIDDANQPSAGATILPLQEFPSPEEKAKEELQNIIGIIQNQNKAFPKSALVAAFKKLNDEGRLPSTPFNVTSPIRPLTPTSPAVQTLGKPSGSVATIITDVDSDCTPTLVTSVLSIDDSILLRPSSTASNYSNSTTSPFM
ncbi:hypothetical protein FDP41_010673 [Naegleria fowleri]|uniref:Uncharacterized protein n=1 Tax=Naegleria fowleri TaxID=5763 RepID=A0A6A5CDM3_NAEFO|nr:uncharacterized protein FDP41_010673 [Naegleria fowleri]KAF0983608.1 hypothetical protein FDP41_010673 [Naegleria fowleri]